MPYNQFGLTARRASTGTPRAAQAQGVIGLRCALNFPSLLRGQIFRFSEGIKSFKTVEVTAVEMFLYRYLP